MSLQKFTVNVTTAADGSFSQTLGTIGRLHAVEILVGDLSTPDLTIQDTDPDGSALTLLADTGIAADARYYPMAVAQDSSGDDLDTTGDVGYVPPCILKRCKVSIAGGGDTKSGTVILLIER